MKKLPPSADGSQRPRLAVMHMNSRARGETLAYFASHLIEDPALPDAETHPERTLELIEPKPLTALVGPWTTFTRRTFQKKTLVLGNMSFAGWEEINE